MSKQEISLFLSKSSHTSKAIKEVQEFLLSVGKPVFCECSGNCCLIRIKKRLNEYYKTL